MNLLKIKNLFFTTAIGLAVAMVYSFNMAPDQSEDWVVPPKYKSMKNPTDKSDINTGKTLYMQHCKSCHGKTGMGDGPKAAELDTPTGDFANAKFQAQSDGELFYKTAEGRDDMPGFGKKIPDEEDIWLIVNFMRTLKG